MGSWKVKGKVLGIGKKLIIDDIFRLFTRRKKKLFYFHRKEKNCLHLHCIIWTIYVFYRLKFITLLDICNMFPITLQRRRDCQQCCFLARSIICQLFRMYFLVLESVDSTNTVLIPHSVHLLSISDVRLNIATVSTAVTIYDGLRVLCEAPRSRCQPDCWGILSKNGSVCRIA